jgi:hypothetical protein
LGNADVINMKKAKRTGRKRPMRQGEVKEKGLPVF